MTASTIAMEAAEPDLVGDLTDKAITNEVAKLERMIAARRADIADLNHEIAQFGTKRDTLIDEQVKRLKAKKRVVVEVCDETSGGAR